MKPTSIVEEPRHLGDYQTAIRRIRQLSAPRVVTGKERRRIDDAKNDLSVADFVILCEKVVRFNRVCVADSVGTPAQAAGNQSGLTYRIAGID
jgi:hypothetical protein